MRLGPVLSCSALAGFVLAGFALPGPTAAAAEMRVAVMEFTSATQDPELAALGKGLQSMVTTDLSAVQTLKVIERERLKEVQAELKLSQGAGFDKKSASKLGKLLGASHLFVGSYTVVGETMRLDGRLIDVAGGDVLLAEQISGEKALFFQLEQTLVQKVIAVLGVKVMPKERAALSRPHTADFGAFQKFSAGIQAFDDGRLEDALKALSEATAIDKDFKLASLTLEEYERLAAQVRAKAEAAGKVEDEVRRLEKNKAIAAEVSVVKKLWQLLDATKGSSAADKLRRVAILCILSDHYHDGLGFRSRGPVSSSDLAEAGFDSFTLARMSDALFRRAWNEAPDVFPRLPPLCVGLHSISSTNPRSIEELLGYHIKDAQKLLDKDEVILSHISNNATLDPVAKKLQLDPPAEIKLWEKVYALAQKLPGLTDEDRARFERNIAELRRTAGDFDGSTQMYAAASRHTKDSSRLREYAREIDKNKALKIAVGSGAALREYFLLRPGTYDNELVSLGKPGAEARLADRLQNSRAVSGRGDWLILGDVPIWHLAGPNFNRVLRTGPRSSQRRAAELRYEGVQSKSFRGEPEGPKQPTILSTAARGRRITVKATIDQSAVPADWKTISREPSKGGAEVGVGFAMKRVVPDGGIERGAPLITVGYGVLVGDAQVHLVQITRDGEHNIAVKRLAEAAVGAGRGKRALEVKVDPGNVSVTVDGKRVSFPWKPEGGDADGFAGFIFDGVGYASLAQPTVTVAGN